jgi:hypothetical protein
MNEWFYHGPYIRQSLFNRLPESSKERLRKHGVAVAEDIMCDKVPDHYKTFEVTSVGDD